MAETVVYPFNDEVKVCLHEDLLRTKTLSVGANPAFKSGKAGEASVGNGPIADTFKVIKGIISPDVVKSTRGIYKFELSGNYFFEMHS